MASKAHEGQPLMNILPGRLGPFHLT